MREGGTSQNGNQTVFETLKERQNEVKKIIEVKNELGRKLKDLHKEFDAVNSEKAALQKQMNPKYHTVEQVTKGIKELEYELQTRTMNSGQEAGLIK